MQTHLPIPKIIKHKYIWIIEIVQLSSELMGPPKTKWIWASPKVPDHHLVQPSTNDRPFTESNHISRKFIKTFPKERANLTKCAKYDKNFGELKPCIATTITKTSIQNNAAHSSRKCKPWKLLVIRSLQDMGRLESQTSLKMEKLCHPEQLTKLSPQWWSGRSTTPYDVLNPWSPIYDPSVWGT